MKTFAVSYLKNVTAWSAIVALNIVIAAIGTKFYGIENASMRMWQDNVLSTILIGAFLFSLYDWYSKK